LAAAWRPRAGDGAVLALERGFALAGPDLDDLRMLPEMWADPTVRMNDGGCDPDGRFYCGSMAYDERTGAGKLYCLDTGGRISEVLSDVTISNGLAWSPDGGTAYYIDTPTRRVDAFDYDPVRGLIGRRPLVRIPPEAGMPDGMTVDQDGRLWVALWGGGAVRCYTADGRFEHEVRLPVTQVTACTFGGPELDELYITTSQQTVPPDEQPEAGALFVARPGVRGLPTRSYDGSG
jgi:sugar lactone lactonase YvrE